MNTNIHPTNRSITGRIRSRLNEALLALALGILPAALHAADISVAVREGSEGDTLSIPVAVADAAGVSGLACTLNYDTRALSVSVRSTFFDSFANQYAAAQVVHPRAISTVVNGVEHLSPMMVTPLPGQGLALAAVRRTPAASGPAPLFVLEVRLNPGARAGNYPITLTPTVVRNGAAGYPLGGESLDLLMGRLPAAGTFPVLLPAVGSALHLIPGKARYLPNTPDTDGDGMPDEWELEQFGNLDSDHRTDTDGDGQPDVVEFLMATGPNDPASRGLLRGEMLPGAYHVYFTVREGHGLTFGLHGTTNFTDWSVEPSSIAPRPDLGSGEGWTTMEAVFPTAGLANLYTRLWIAVPIEAGDAD